MSNSVPPPPPPPAGPPNPPPAAPPGGGYGPTPAQNGLGTAALVLGILGFFCLPMIGPILAIVFGKMGMAKADQGLATNRGNAKAGFILGIIALAGWLLYFVVTFGLAMASSV